jgi:hypothetical protein
VVGEVKKKFEVLVFNKVVRDLVEREEHHRHYKDDWADVHEETGEAFDLESARRRAEARFPARSGFVIVEIREVESKFDESE